MVKHKIVGIYDYGNTNAPHVTLLTEQNKGWHTDLGSDEISGDNIHPWVVEPLDKEHFTRPLIKEGLIEW